MNCILPGTVLEMDRGEADQAEAKISALFLAGGMVLSQVTDLTGLEPYTVQNWVKRGFLPPPSASAIPGGSCAASSTSIGSRAYCPWRRSAACWAM